MAGKQLTALASERVYGERFGERYVDMEIEVCEWGPDGWDGPPGDKLIDVGGRWDKERRRWSGQAKSHCHWRVQPAQYDAMRWFTQWLQHHVAGTKFIGDAKTRTVLAAGGRRGGKSDWAVRCAVLYAVACPKAIVWAISETQDETKELRDVIDNILPAGDSKWCRWREAKEVFEFWNGSVIELKSGYKPSSLKRGRIDMWVINEGQKFPKKAYTILRAPLADNRGLGLVTANPPDEPRGQWVLDAHGPAQAKKGGWRLFTFDARLNPETDWASLESMKDDPAVSLLEYKREVLGEFIPIGDRVFHSWSPRENIGDPPAGYENITRAFTKAHLGTSYDFVVSADFQVYPHMVGIIWGVYRDKDGDEIPWIVGEAIVDEGDEDMLIDELEAQGLTAKTAVVVGDASGEWQGGKRLPKHESFKIFRRRKWRIVPPDTKQNRNPDIIASCRATNGLIQNAQGKRRLMCVADAVRTKDAVSRWPTKNGAPFKRSDYAHIGDAVRYFVWRFWPRRGKKKKFEFTTGPRVPSQIEKELDGW